MFDFRAPVSVLQDENRDNVKLYGQLRRGNWSESQLEISLKTIFAYSKQHKDRLIGKELVEIGAQHMDIFAELKKEFNSTRELLNAMLDGAAARDELVGLNLRP